MGFFQGLLDVLDVATPLLDDPGLVFVVALKLFALLPEARRLLANELALGFKCGGAQTNVP